MIQEQRRLVGTEAMTKKEDFSSFYARKLEALKIELKDIIKGDVPYTTGMEYACPVCRGRIKLHSQGDIYCLRCQMPSVWPRELKACVTAILQRYPSLAEAEKEWQALQSAHVARVLTGNPTPKTGDEQLGKRIRAARESLGWKQEDLADKIYKPNGRKLARTTIQGYETAQANPSKHVLEQLEQLLGLEVTKC
jgi:DNA-binding XRE family transcriptional regulator